MKKDCLIIFECFHKSYKELQVWKKAVCFLSFIVFFLTFCSLILPAVTLNDDDISYTLLLKDSYDYEWKSNYEKEYNLKLYYMDNHGNHITGKDLTLEIGANALADDPYGFGYVPINGETTRGKDILSVWNISEYILSTGEKYIFDHAEVLIDGVWQPFLEDSTHWDIWCQYASSSEKKDDYGWRGKYGANVSYNVTSDLEYKLVYQEVRYGTNHLVSSLGGNSGIAFKMFNYSGDNGEVGINANGLYDYFSFRDSSIGTPNINKETDADGFTENRAKVLPNLQNGYPVFNCQGYCNNASLGYLFGDSTNPLGTNPIGVTSYNPSNTLLQTEMVNGVEYYYYDSNRNAVDYDTFNNQFLVRDYVERGKSLSSYPAEVKRYEFMPFNYWNSNRTVTTIADTGFTYNYEVTEMDHWFGMTMEFKFYMPKNGEINGEDMIFSFSGDDDVWVFVDDVLVLDLGGTHGAVDGTINFKTGEVSAFINWNDIVGDANDSSIYQSFQEANALDTVSWNDANTTFENYTLHTVKFFYLERGAAISNCKIRFNIPVLPSGSLSVQKVFDGKTNYDDAYEFTLFDVTNGETVGVNKATYLIGNQEFTTDEKGRFTLKEGQVATFKLTNYHKYYVMETNSGNHSVSYQCHLNGESCSSANQTNIFEINPESLYRATFTNKIKTYDLKISKIAYGTNLGETFGFRVKLEDTLQNIDLKREDIISSNEFNLENDNSEISFNLQHEEEIVIKNIPLDTKVKMEEIFYDGYNPVIKSGEAVLANGNSYEFVMDDDKEITVHNIPGVMLPETGGIGIWPYILIGLTLIFISAKYAYTYLYKWKEG